MADEVTTTTMLAAIPSSLVGLVLLGNFVWKKFKVDTQDVKQIERATELVKSQNETIAMLNDQIEKRNDRIDELMDRNESLTKERNDALVENATLRSQINHLTENLANANHALRNANQKIEFILTKESKQTDVARKPKNKPTGSE